jgi:hypothetical protein
LEKEILTIGDHRELGLVSFKCEDWVSATGENRNLVFKVFFAYKWIEAR